MTKNNLAVHLKWLLDRDPSLYSCLAALETHPSHAEDRVSQQPTPPEDDFEGLGGIGKNDDDDVTTRDTMARLLFASSSASKPRMLSRLETLSENPSSSKKRSQAKQSSVNSGTQYEPPASSHKQSRPKATPLRSEHVFDTPPVGPIEAIDLTGDTARAIFSSGTVEFGESRQLWTEGAASRDEPREQRGKKRKSDEYTSDLLSPLKHASKVRTPSKAIKPLSGEVVSISRSANRASPTTAQKQDQHHSSVASRKQHKQLIADSDDEEDLFDSWIGEDADVDDMMLDADSGSYPKLPEISPAADRKATAAPASAVPRSSAPKHALSELPSSQQPAQTESNVVAKDFGHSHSSPWPKSSDSQEKHPSILKFLALPPDFLEQSIARLKSILQKNAEIVYQQAMEGRPAPELISENKTLVSRIQAIEVLQTHRDAHKNCVSRKDSLKQTLMQAISHGLDPTTMPEELAQSRAIEAEVEQIEARICQLLPQANILESAKVSRTVHTGSSPEARKEPATSAQSGSFQGLGPTRNSPSASPRTTVKHQAFQKTQSCSGNPNETTQDVRSRMFESDDLAHNNERACISRNMRSPLLQTMDLDDFDWDAGDDDMLEVTETVEDRRIPVRDQTTQSRKVFAETSGNSSRVPSTKKSPGRSAFWSHHPWSQEVRTVLKDRFHLRGFRPNQLEAIDATLGGKDTFILMPTGGGKSLCYQLPSVVTSGTTRGVTIVISPLLSLMQDQVAHLRKLDIQAFLMNGESDKDERQWILGQLSHAAGEGMELLYITPEMINKNQTLVRALEKLHRRQRLARIVIDEAHCVSQWGHDFRPDYKELGEVRTRLPGVPVMALTATATENVKVDVMHNLKMSGCEVFLQSFNRPNLTYEVRAKGKNDEVLASIAETITGSYRNQCGIVYCLSRKTCEKVAEDLRKKYNLKAKHYHAAMKPHDKAEVQTSWQMGQCHVIVATIAFGMGIDKPNVRFVIHHSIPKSLEGYYQETGRAGRDGKRSGCYLYYGYRDTATLKRMIDEGDGSPEQKARQKQMLRNVVQFCENRSDCRRVQVLAYFNEYFRREDCNASCDNCKSDLVFEVHDFSQFASWAIKIVRQFQTELKEKVTVLYCVDILRGDLKKAKSPAHRRIPGYGEGSDLERGEAERLFYRLLGEDALSEENVINGKDFAIQYIRLGRRALEFETGERQMKLQVRVSPAGKSKAARPAQRSKAGNSQGYPQSTMVSSPIQSAKDRRLARSHQRTAQEPDSSDGSDSDGFERIRVAGKPRSERTTQLGPPITSDQKMDRLDHLHRAVVEDFEVTAKRFLQDIVIEKGLRCQPFPDNILRDMAITFPKDLSELSAIPGIDQDKVKRYGRQILRLVDNAKRRYQELKQDAQTHGIVPDPNHHNVINLSSSDEYSEDDDLFMDPASTFDLDNPQNSTTEDITSRYFPPPPSPGFDPGDDAAEANSLNIRKRQPSKRPRRKNGSTGSWKARSSKSKAKSGSRASSRSSAPRRTATKAKTPKSTIGMMPI